MSFLRCARALAAMRPRYSRASLLICIGALRNGRDGAHLFLTHPRRHSVAIKRHPLKLQEKTYIGNYALKQGCIVCSGFRRRKNPVAFIPQRRRWRSSLSVRRRLSSSTPLILQWSLRVPAAPEDKMSIRWRRPSDWCIHRQALLCAANRSVIKCATAKRRLKFSLPNYSRVRTKGREAAKRRHGANRLARETARKRSAHTIFRRIASQTIVLRNRGTASRTFLQEILGTLWV